MEIAFVDPQLMSLSTENNFTIPVGTMAVIPHMTEEQWDEMKDENGYLRPGALRALPEGTLILGGQSLERELYPELSREYANSGGFHHFELPDLRKKFILGIDPDTEEFQWGDGVVYYETVPKIDIPIRDIRQLQ